MSDLKWMQFGGTLLDGSGDLALAGPYESLQDMVRTRLKAALNGWQLYAIGADLERALGETVSAELELALRRQVTQALSRNLLPPGSFEVRSVASGQTIRLYVYISDQLVQTATLYRESGLVEVS